MPIPALIGIAANLLPSIIGLFNKDAAKTVSQVTDIAKQIFATDDPEAIEAAIAKDPALSLQLKLALAEYADREAQRTHDEIIERIKDVGNARGRDVNLAQVGRKNYRADIMLLMAFLSFMAIIYMVWVARLNIPEGVMALLNMSAGALLKMISDAFQFEFGSSRSSKDKTEVMLAQSQK